MTWWTYANARGWDSCRLSRMRRYQSVPVADRHKPGAVAHHRPREAAAGWTQECLSLISCQPLQCSWVAQRAVESVARCASQVPGDRKELAAARLGRLRRHGN